MYVELILLQDLTMDLILLGVTTRLWHRAWSWPRALMAAGLGGMWSVSTLWIPVLRWMAWPVMALMGWICWPQVRWRHRVGMAATVMALAMVAAGAAQLFQGGGTLAAAGGCLLAALAVLRPAAPAGAVTAETPFGPRTLMIDSGLRAVEPVSGLPVVLLDRVPEGIARPVRLQGVGGGLWVQAVPMTLRLRQGKHTAVVTCYAAAVDLPGLKADGLIGSWIETEWKEHAHVAVEQGVGMVRTRVDAAGALWHRLLHRWQ